MLLTRHVIKIKLRLWVTESRVKKWFDRTNTFFILAIGRSGTAFLADLLNQANGSAVYHEPVDADRRAYPQAFHNSKKALEYVRSFRKKEMYLRAGDRMDITTYGEVNSWLRRHAQAIKESFPNATLIHLIRDGRHVVRSMMARKTMTPQDKTTSKIYPSPADPWHVQWQNMDRFARLCWYWQVENAYLRTNIGETVHLEKILNNYDYFHDNVLEPCQIELPKGIWERAVNNPKNVTAQHSMASWNDWDPSQRETFLRICGQEMRNNGFEI